MKIPVRYIFALYLQLSFISAACQQHVSLPFEMLTINDGLSQGFVSSIIQDKMGLMWSGTSDGLNRYDGYKFVIYHHDPSDSTSLSDSEINCVFEDSKQRLWSWSEKLFDYYHRKVIEVRTLSH